MAGIVYLRTNRFEVKLEGITFKAKDFESLCSMDFLFPKGKIWASPPIVGIDVMRHPRDPSIILVVLCFGVGCIILRFHSGDILPEAISKFLTDERIRFVGFGIPEKKDLFPFEELGLTKTNVDIGYLAAKHLDNSKYKRCELAELARKVLRIKKMIGLTESSSFERHEQIKCAICQLFITCAIAMALLGAKKEKKFEDSPKKGLFLKNFHSLPLFTEGWFKFPKSKTENDKTLVESCPDFNVQTRLKENLLSDDIHAKITPKEGPFADGDSGDDPFLSNDSNNSSGDDLVHGKGSGTLRDIFNLVKRKEYISTSNPSMEAACASNKPLKGILKCPSSPYEGPNPCPIMSDSPPSGFQDQKHATGTLKRANSKGFNVSFKCQ